MSRIFEEKSDLWEIPLEDVVNLTKEEFEQRNGIYIRRGILMKDPKDIITRKEFDLAARKECRAIWQEYQQAKNIEFVHYKVNAKDFLRYDVVPTWRVDLSNRYYGGIFEKDRDELFAISYQSLATKHFIFDRKNFNPGYDKNSNYFTKTSQIIVFCCKGCGIMVVKDGNHRLLQTTVKGENRELEVYQVNSDDWSDATIDMKNFCKCTFFVGK